MGDAETVELAEEDPRILEACDHALVVAEEGPALGDARQELRAVLEAGAIDEAENG